METVQTPLLREENEDPFLNKQLVSRMFDCLDGAEFERNLLPLLEGKDRYARLKLHNRTARLERKGQSGQDRGADESYSRRVLEYLDQEQVRKLLYCCRFCSYLGGPGFPDLILFGHGIEFRYTSRQLPAESVMFALLAKTLGIGNLKILWAVPAGGSPGEAVRIEIGPFLQGLMKEQRFVRLGEGLESLIREERENLGREQDPARKRQVADEVRKLEGQREQMPFFLVKKWARDGIRERDLLENMERLELLLQEDAELEARAREVLEADAEFQKLGRGRDEGTLRKKMDYIMQKFGVGESRAEEILKSL